MQAPKAQILKSPLQKPLVAAILAATGCGAFAQEAPATNYLGLRETVGRTSNVFVVPDGPHDYFYTTSLLGGLDKTYSRQRLYGTADVDLNRYHSATALNNTGYNVNGGWDWATIEKLSGSFTGSATKSLASLSGNASIPTTERNLAKTDQLAAIVRWGGEGLLSLEGSFGHSRVSYSDPAYITQESSADTSSLGGFYRVGPTLRLGLAGRFTRVYQPNAAPVAGGGGFQSETTDGKNLDLTADWQYSVQTNVNARLSYTKQTFSGSTSGDGFSGLTGAIYANYQPTGKLFFSAALLRDAGINATFFNVIGAPTTTTGPTTSTVSLSENSQVTNTGVLGLRYLATAKIAGTLGYQYRNSKTDAADGTTTGTQNDKLQTVSLGLTYDFDRNWQLACNYSHQNRDVSGVGPFTYIVNMTSCSAQFLLR
ncbi:MAG TPA: hypothetical protein VGM74_07320 [Burkholderiaceae bacterium]|jgi:outer membrane receptor protein involved in Fe transport